MARGKSKAVLLQLEYRLKPQDSWHRSQKMTIYSLLVRNGTIVSYLCFALIDEPSILCGGSFYLGLPPAVTSDVNWYLMDCEEVWEWLCVPSQAVSPCLPPPVPGIQPVATNSHTLCVFVWSLCDCDLFHRPSLTAKVAGENTNCSRERDLLAHSVMWWLNMLQIHFQCWFYFKKYF